VTRLPRPAALVTLALVVGTSAGCSVTNPQTTQLQYTPSDGAQALLSADVLVTSVLIAAADREGPGNLIARVVNDGLEPATVRITGGGEADVDHTVTVPPRSTRGLGPEADEAVPLETVGAIPGALVPMTVALVGGESMDIEVPVLDATLEEYAELVPTPARTGV
jgi:hypothetical protein